MSAAGPEHGALILVLNCGSSSLKCALFETRGGMLPRQSLWRGKVEGIGTPGASWRAGAAAPRALLLDSADPGRAALAHVLGEVQAWLGGRTLAAVSHRVVHGGGKYHQPVAVDAATLAELAGFTPLAPLHQPFALAAIGALRESLPQVAQVACFDTAFHHTLPRVEQLLPLPHWTRARGLRRYGFHGLSYDYLARVLPERHGEAARGRVIVAHLGSGASLCALQHGRSVATSMGFSALDGLMMGTRSGALDPGVLLYLLEQEGMAPERLSRMLYRESGLAGVSGLSSELPLLLANEARADAGGELVRDALALYVRRIVREVGALVAVLGGLDLLAFTAGVGENSAPIRARVCRDLGFLGLALDEAANLAGAALISTPSSRVAVAVEPTNEEWIAALQAAQLLGLAGAQANSSSAASPPSAQ